MLGFLGDIISAGANVYNQESTNTANKEINQMNNEFNAMEAQKSRDFALEMWEKNNTYNSPANQVARLKEAGINPAFAMGDIASGQVSSAASTPNGASSSGNAHMQAAQIPMLGSSFRDAMRLKNEVKLSDSQSNKLDAETEQQVADNETRRLENIARIDNIIANTKNEDLKAKAQEIQNGYLNDMLGEDYRNKVRQGKLLDAQTHEIVSRTIYQEMVNANYPEQFKLQVAESFANIAESESRTKVNEKEVVNKMAQALESVAKSNEIKLNTDITEAAKDDIIAEIKYRNNKSYLDSATNFVRDVGTLLVGYFLLKGKPVKIKGFGK